MANGTKTCANDGLKMHNANLRTFVKQTTGDLFIYGSIIY